MTIKECIDIVDNAKPNQYGIKEKVMWLSFVDETIINDVLKTHEGYDGRFDNFEGYTEDKLSVPLIVPSPYDRLYPQYIKMMIDSENGETARYNNSAALYNTYLNEYKKYYNKTHMPLNATQKIPSPVSININSALSEAQIEYIKRQLYYMLSQDVDEVVSRDKLYDIVTSFVSNNLEMLKTKLAMSYKGETSVLPENAKENDVYKLSETIYEEGMYYIPMDMGDIGESDGIIRYYFDSVFGSDVIDVVTQMVEDGKTNNLALFDGDVRFDIPLVGAGYDNGFYIGSTKETYDYFGHHFKYILVPSEYGEDFFFGRNAVKFHKGELVVFTDKGWVSADAETLKNIRYDLDDFKTEVGERFNSNDESYATINLENVSNEDFKRKAEEAGVGGDNAELLGDAPMVFKGVVSELPDTANEGEVYKITNFTIASREKIDTFDCSNYGTTIYKDHLDDAYGAPIYSAIQNAYNSGNSNKGFVLVENGKEFTIIPTSFGSVENEYVGTIYVVYGTTNVDDYHTFESGNVDLYMGDVNSTSNLYVRHNGEWV